MSYYYSHENLTSSVRTDPRATDVELSELDLFTRTGATFETIFRLTTKK